MQFMAAKAVLPSVMAQEAESGFDPETQNIADWEEEAG